MPNRGAKSRSVLGILLVCGNNGLVNVGCGMCVYDVHEMVVSLNLNDTPVGYAPPKGPAAGGRTGVLTELERRAAAPVRATCAVAG